MSGGVDSSVAAARLKDSGYDCVGVFLRVGAEPPEPEVCALDDPQPQPRRRLKHGCCSATDALDARLIAGKLGMPFYALNFKDDFDRIIDYFVDEYAQARTPNPCVMCNIHVKFGKLFEYADLLDAEFVATGHYARVLHVGGAARLARSLNRDKDQSYVLFGIRRNHLPRCLFPIGEITDKAEVRATAASLGLSTHDKPDSQEICFVPDQDYKRLVRERRPATNQPGEVRDASGAVIGQHDGVVNFTIGQRKGLGIAAGRPIYVTRLDVLNNVVEVGDRDALLHSGLVADQLNWLTDPPRGPTPCEIKIRHMHTPAPGVMECGTPAGAASDSSSDAAIAPTTITAQFDTPQSAVTPGQAAVFYDDDLVIAGGWIREALSTNAATAQATTTNS